jgi:hypothetical protein
VMGPMPAPEAAALLIALKKRKSDKKKKRKTAKEQRRRDQDKIKVVPNQLPSANSPSPGRTTNSLAMTSVAESELPPNPTTMTNSSPPPAGIRASAFNMRNGPAE